MVRIATAILLRFGVQSKDIDLVLEFLSTIGDIKPFLRLYQRMMSQRDAGWSDFEKNEEHHVAAVGYAILKSPLVKIKPEYNVVVRTLTSD